jgi:hypothetical protein
MVDRGDGLLLSLAELVVYCDSPTIELKPVLTYLSEMLAVVSAVDGPDTATATLRIPGVRKSSSEAIPDKSSLDPASARYSRSTLSEFSAGSMILVPLSR